MSELRRLSAGLCEGLPQGASGVHGLLHLAGLRGSATGLALLLGELSELSPEFNLLGVAYPVVQPWTGLLGQADVVLRQLRALQLRPPGHPLAASVARAVQSSDDGLVGVCQKAGFVDLLASDHSPMPAARLVRAAAYLTGVVRQASHNAIPGWEEPAQPERWLLQLVQDFAPLAASGVGSDGALQAADPLVAIADACAQASAAGDAGSHAARLPDALRMVARVFKAPGARNLGAQVQAHFEALARQSAGTPAVADGADQVDPDDQDDEDDAEELEDEPAHQPPPAGAPAADADAPAAAASTAGSNAKPQRVVGQRGSRPSNRLTERQILLEHRRAFMPSEQAELTALIEQALTEPASVYPDSRPALDGQGELLIAAVARCLARTVTGASQTRIVDYSRMAYLMPQHLPRERCIFVSHLEHDSKYPLHVGYADDEDLAREHQEAGWTLMPLPGLLGDRLRQLARDVLDAELQELLPFVPGGWDAAAAQWLLKKFSRFNGSIGDFNLANRHALARALFAATGNRALIDLACLDLRTPSGKPVRTVSLSAYLHPGTARDKLEYLRAATGLISTAPPALPADWQPVFTAMPAAVLQALGCRLQQQAVSPLTARARHEGVAVYTVLALVLGTGHRESQHIFHFPWDLDLEEAVAFVCDKLSIGSEARFIPLVRRLVQMVQTYRKHLVALIDELKGSDPKLAREIALAAGLTPPGRRAKDKLVEGHPVGQFFLIRGQKIVTLGAESLEQLCRAALADTPEMLVLWDLAPGGGSLLKRLRRNIATFLWTGGLSGAMVEAFLGHNRALHVFGEASTWSVLGDLARVLPLVERYLDAVNWQPLTLGAAVDRTVVPAIKLPQRRTGEHGYEGREREASLAHARACRAVREVTLGLTQEQDELITLDDAAVDILRDEAAQALGDDPAARDKLLQAFATLSDQLKFKQGITISAVKVATRHQEPGPVEVGFARDLALAGAIRAGWPVAVLALLGESKRDQKPPELAWLAVIATSLVVNDALLDPQQIWPILESVHARRVRVVEGRVQVRATVVSTRSEFERAVYLSRASTAAVVGLHRAHKMAPPPDRLLDRQGLETQLASLVDQVPGLPPGAAPGLATLASIFRAWWFLRLPGVAYAVGIGQRDAPSCDEITERTLLGADPPSAVARIDTLRAARRAPVADEIKAGGRAIQAILKEAEGDPRQGTQCSRHQRRELRHLFQEGLSDELTALLAVVPMAELRVGFVEHLLVHGGIEQDYLAFGTIQAYDGALSDLYARWWHQDPRAFTSAEFDATYGALLRSAEATASQDSLKLLRTALRNFHAFMRQSERAPEAPVLGLRFQHARRRTPRSTLLAPRLFGPSLETARALAVDDTERSERVSTLLTLCRAYGTRRKEALYSLARDYQERAGALSLRVQSNAANKLKNPQHGTRLVPFGLAGDDADRYLRAVVDVATPSHLPQQPIFADPTAAQPYLDFEPITRTALATLKLSAGNARMTLHGERHGFATRIGLALTPEAGEVSAIRRIRKELAVEPAVAETIAALSPSQRDWPFQIDRASMWHGNAGVANYLDVYFHGGNWLLAEHADAHAIDGRMNPAHWAALMGMTRTNIVHQRRAWQVQDGEGADLSDARVVAHFLGKLDLQSALVAGGPAVGGSTENAAGAPAGPARLQLTFAIADSLLVRRHEDGWGLDELGYIAESDMRLRRDEVQRFVAGYRELFADTDFRDFEPEGSDVLAGVAANRAGVARSAPRRQALLAQMAGLLKKEPVGDALRRMLQNWRQWVSPKRLLLVSRRPDEACQFIDVLLALGFSRGELRLWITPNWQRQHGQGSISGLVPEVDRALRFSRGVEGVAVAELGVEVVGRMEDALVSNADLHRAMMVACACGM